MEERKRVNGYNKEQEKSIRNLPKKNLARNP